jgi:hypothetical protein
MRLISMCPFKDDLNGRHDAAFLLHLCRPFASWISVTSLPRLIHRPCSVLSFGPCDLDARVAASEDGLCGCLYGEQRGSGDGLSLWPVGSKRWGIVVLAALRQRQLLYRGLEALVGDIGWFNSPEVIKRFLWVKTQR